uniref:ribulose-phosphate 3-epimerase n=1 Tax=Chromera velia CCMP2878 TaxID=1169474 RepID=A0A0G4I463_9ALVE|eukprot:Cvel_10846.t1-p1 / transcript=Cvel_10846.t1 / gene=Cvel_10846 / organism=Chromera_velia_CCMP2878 / gene_product=Ribulose-phosphate 3-epimerase, putative / transcript_product=Ribulose-phosphate 3-epimerase, putative / location=Cvel_scaffold664:5660-8990(+) / protein_length=203 / sequence_SO=supercontig / SO=protein_coding / is_pseudo=false
MSALVIPPKLSGILHFVPNITFGAPVVKSLRKNIPNAFFDCHLMVSNPGQWIEDFKKAGADQFTFHLETCEGSVEKAVELIDRIVATGMKAGITVKPSTPVEDSVFPVLRACPGKIHTVLIMTVEPGFGGQSFMESMMAKVEKVRLAFPQVIVQVDGGLNVETTRVAAKAGATAIVAGTAIFGAKDPAAVVAEMRSLVNSKGG